ncbi:MAG: methionine biosynthesis protein MetW [Deltaproteobacteria bacterium]|nr:methionine biosynthesis protein MetW [Deltaproteobacteria bacterium]
MTDQYISNLNRTDSRLIFSMIPEGARVLDLGCGDCRLLGELVQQKNVVGLGVDIDGDALVKGMPYGLSIYQGDLDDGLTVFPDGSYDYVILNQTLQVVKKPLQAIREMLRIGQYGIVGFPNFGHWRLRLGLLTSGRAPKSPTLPFEWYDTPNIRVLTIRDFMAFCREEHIRIVKKEYLMGTRWRSARPFQPFANLFAGLGLFVITRGA